MDFSSLFKIPWLENAFPFSQVFPSEWEPWEIDLFCGRSKKSRHNIVFQFMTEIGSELSCI